MGKDQRNLNQGANFAHNKFENLEDEALTVLPTARKKLFLDWPVRAIIWKSTSAAFVST